MHFIRRHSSTLTRVNLALFGLLWLAVVGAPCVMAMQVEQAGGHDCPHCPPSPCHEVAPDDCDEADWLDGLRAGEQFKNFELPLLIAPAISLHSASDAASAPFFHTPPGRAGPRVHVLHTRFDE